MKIAVSRGAESHCYVASGSDCFRILGFSLNRDHNRLDSRVRRIRNRRGGSTSLNVHQKCMGFPRPIPQPEKGLFPSCGGPLRGAVKSETKSEIRRSSAHMCNTHGDTHASIRSYTIYIHITVHRHSPWNGVYLDSTGVFPVDAFHPSLFSFFPRSFLFLARLEKNHARGMHSRRANCARARRRFSQIRFFNANVTLTPSSDNSIK